MADNTEVIRMLNEDLTGEVEAILVYSHSHFVLEDEAPTALAMLEIAIDEMRHVQWLAEQIVELGGEPQLLPHRVRFAGRDLAEALQRGIDLEREAIANYNAHIAAIADPAIQRMLAHIRDEEVDHEEEFKALLAEAKGPGDRRPTVGDLTGEAQ
jgi:bacterioferritin